MFLVSSCRYLCPIHWSQVLSWEWRCSWSSADRRCSNYIGVINNFIAYWGATYISDFTAIKIHLSSQWACKTRMMQNHFRTQNDLEIGSLTPIFNTPLKVAKIDQDQLGNQRNFFEKMTKDQNFDIFWDPKRPITSKSTCNEHVKQYWCETSENFLRI